ncbi:MAG: hypothetical protein MK110_10185 [Fuerstiella sp.]|nr:hypothetical protein [Fuerstiella sp.]
MSKFLAVSWNSQSLHYVFGEKRKGDAVHVLAAGEKKLVESVQSDSDGPAPDVLRRLREITDQLKVGRAKLILCVNRGCVESVEFTVPPATDDELPTLVQNMARRQLSGPGEDASIDFISFPPRDDGSGYVNAMAMAPEDEQLIHNLAEFSGCTKNSAVVVTHPLRVFVPDQQETDQSAVLVVSVGSQSAHLLVVRHQRPVLSRTLSLARGQSREAEARFVTGEIQRTMLSIGDRRERNVEVNRAVLVGSPLETEILAGQLEGRVQLAISHVSASKLVTGDIADLEQGAYAPLIAALLETASGVTPAVDFLNPRRPSASSGRRNRWLAVAVLLLILSGGGWYYTDSLFAEQHREIAELKAQLEPITESLRKTAPLIRQASGLSRWERSRMNWLDEIRDITIRMPSSPDVSVRQFAATPARTGFTVTFQGISSSPEAHRAMEIGIQDRYHTTRTPSFSESRSGKDVVWNFRTTLQILKRENKDYTAHRQSDWPGDLRESGTTRSPQTRSPQTRITEQAEQEPSPPADKPFRLRDEPKSGPGASQS